jgi:hypothetical protein
MKTAFCHVIDFDASENVKLAMPISPYPNPPPYALPLRRRDKRQTNRFANHVKEGKT